jgi:hypothetical protein
MSLLFAYIVKTSTAATTKKHHPRVMLKALSRALPPYPLLTAQVILSLILATVTLLHFLEPISSLWAAPNEISIVAYVLSTGPAQPADGSSKESPLLKFKQLLPEQRNLLRAALLQELSDIITTQMQADVPTNLLPKHATDDSGARHLDRALWRLLTSELLRSGRSSVRLKYSLKQYDKENLETLTTLFRGSLASENALAVLDWVKNCSSHGPGTSDPVYKILWRIVDTRLRVEEIEDLFYDYLRHPDFLEISRRLLAPAGGEHGRSIKYVDARAHIIMAWMFQSVKTGVSLAGPVLGVFGKGLSMFIE